ncbi:MAG: hypothetical protein U0U66_14710 [Cytophagaceae bacterium]
MRRILFYIIIFIGLIFESTAKSGSGYEKLIDSLSNSHFEILQNEQLENEDIVRDYLKSVSGLELYNNSNTSEWVEFSERYQRKFLLVIFPIYPEDNGGVSSVKLKLEEYTRKYASKIDPNGNYVISFVISVINKEASGIYTLNYLIAGNQSNEDLYNLLAASYENSNYTFESYTSSQIIITTENCISNKGTIKVLVSENLYVSVVESGFQPILFDSKGYLYSFEYLSAGGAKTIYTFDGIETYLSDNGITKPCQKISELSRLKSVDFNNSTKECGFHSFYRGVFTTNRQNVKLVNLNVVWVVDENSYNTLINGQVNITDRLLDIITITHSYRNSNSPYCNYNIQYKEDVIKRYLGGNFTSDCIVLDNGSWSVELNRLNGNLYYKVKNSNEKTPLASELTKINEDLKQINSFEEVYVTKDGKTYKIRPNVAPELVEIDLQQLKNNINAGTWDDNSKSKAILTYADGKLKFDALGIKNNLSSTVITTNSDLNYGPVQVNTGENRVNYSTLNAHLLQASNDYLARNPASDVSSKPQTTSSSTSTFPDGKDVEISSDLSCFEIICKSLEITKKLLQEGVFDPKLYNGTSDIQLPPVLTGSIEGGIRQITDITSMLSMAYDVVLDPTIRQQVKDGFVQLSTSFVDNPTLIFPVAGQVIVEELTGSSPEAITSINWFDPSSSDIHVISKGVTCVAMGGLAAKVTELPKIAMEVSDKIISMKATFMALFFSRQNIKSLYERLTPSDKEVFLEKFKNADDATLDQLNQNPESWKNLTVVKKSDEVVQSLGKLGDNLISTVIGDIRKFSEYALTNPSKTGLFVDSWGYQLADADNLLSIYKNQAIQAVKEGNAIFNKTTQYGDEYKIIISLSTPKKGQVTIYSGWIIKKEKLDELILSTPYDGFVK